jgi:hypothetical protein
MPFWTEYERKSLNQGLATIRGPADSLAREGDAVGDAIFLKEMRNTELQVFVDLYGLMVNQVLELCKWSGISCKALSKANERVANRATDGGVIKVLNAYTTVRSDFVWVPPTIERLFQAFIAAVQKYWHLPPQWNPQTQVYRAWCNISAALQYPSLPDPRAAK